MIYRCKYCCRDLTVENRHWKHKQRLWAYGKGLVEETLEGWIKWPCIYEDPIAYTVVRTEEGKGISKYTERPKTRS